MSSSQTVLRSFLNDALRLSQQAHRYFQEIIIQFQSGQAVSVAKVKSLFHAVHSLKGTASMVPGADAIVKVLHELESELGLHSLVQSAENPTQWIAMARQSLPEAARLLQQMDQVSRRREASGMGPGLGLQDGRSTHKKGLLVQADLREFGERERWLWFPLTQVVRVFSAQEMSGRRAVQVNGSWVPVVGGASSLSCPALAVRIPSPSTGREMGQSQNKNSGGVLVLSILRVRAIATWDESVHLGSTEGVSFLINQLELKLPVAA